MRRLAVWCGLIAAVALLSAAAVTGQDKKAKNKQLPQNYGKLGLSDEQKKKIYAIQDEYGDKINDLTKQLEALRKKQREEMAAVLTDEQRQELKKILSEKAGDTKPTTDKKPGDKPTGDKKPGDKDTKPSDK